MEIEKLMPYYIGNKHFILSLRQICNICSQCDNKEKTVKTKQCIGTHDRDCKIMHGHY